MFDRKSQIMRFLNMRKNIVQYNASDSVRSRDASLIFLEEISSEKKFLTFKKLVKIFELNALLSDRT